MPLKHHDERQNQHRQADNGAYPLSCGLPGIISARDVLRVLELTEQVGDRHAC